MGCPPGWSLVEDGSLSTTTGARLGGRCRSQSGVLAAEHGRPRAVFVGGCSTLRRADSLYRVRCARWSSSCQVEVWPRSLDGEEAACTRKGRDVSEERETVAREIADEAASERTDPVADIVKASALAEARSPLTPMTTRFATKANSRFVPGRRDWLQYLDAGLAEASGGRVSLTLSAATGAMVIETGWHFHECEMQIGYITQGWIELQYEDGTEVRLEAGDVMFVPGGVRHNELRTSDDISGLEITIPAAMGTVSCAKPDGWQPKSAVQ